ncbi:hypothetical protein COCVIDRAFT_42647 [Bipolaris victoriae FI3]|uniref:Azaphilone pigments biosynthesis cluster protein L N-terminal domain-containing protein n=1 Tax=Bipolaris victoriae (strain FI3) TaxID=930091 RepID=W7E2Q1_BIPV3|nr:hypothetical protein COCVIDRAFT_42647 [Bipolaris victoriae FI3]
MADPISAVSAIITLVTFGIKSSSTLYQTLKELNNHQKYVRELKAELDVLSLVLASLHQAILDDEADFTLLKLPLFRCGCACIEFNMVVKDATKQFYGSLASFRDWAKLKYMGDDIDNFTDSLAAYKSTINIALTDSSVALERLGDYKDLITTAKNDLEARLETIDEKLQSLVERTMSSSATPELQRLKEERSSTQKCLLICAQFSTLIQQLQSSSAKDFPQGVDSIPEKITSDSIRECRITMEQTNIRSLAKLREEWTSTRKCRDICSQAEQNLKENVSVIDNYATGNEAVQFLVSNSQKIIHGKNRGHGDYIK